MSASLNNTVVIIPAFNEEHSIGRVLGDIPREAVAEIVVVNNGSTDRTAEVARAAGATVLNEARRGYGYACLAGLEYAFRKDPGIIVFLDGDYSDYPGDLPLLTKPIIEDGYDLVIGSRVIGERERGALLPQAVFGNWLATLLIRMVWGYRFTDLGPFRAATSKALRAMNVTDPTFGWTVEMQIKAAKLGLKCTEVPVRYRKRIGESKVTGTLSGTLKASYKILFTIFKYALVR